jgi:phosphoribosyl-AMP cyclohydrolase
VGQGRDQRRHAQLVEVRVNCEQNSLLFKVLPQGKGACHTKDVAGKTRMGCYYRKLVDGKLEHAE